MVYGLNPVGHRSLFQNLQPNNFRTMLDFLYSIDKSIFIFCNQTLANPLFDAFMPILTDLNHIWWGRVLFVLAWGLLFFKGGKKGKILACLLIVLIVVTDQLNSSVLKNIVQRPRPCHLVDGLPVVENIHLLVNCGGGYSFPSSHAANNFAAAFLLSFYYRRWTWAFFLFAGTVGFSRMSVGVHYPSDVVGGAFVGLLCAGFIILSWNLVVTYFPRLEHEPFQRLIIKDSRVG